MEDFFPNQRYTSSGEPELGMGIVLEVSKDKVQIHFPVADEMRLYAKESAPLNRIIFKVGDTIIDHQGQSMLIEKVQLEGNIYVYFGKDTNMLEAEIGAGTATTNVDDRLFMGDIDTPEMFALRRETLYNDYQRKISPVHGFVGGKIDLIPHQLYIAHEVSSRFAPRVLLSDQVGLGKTIEACLILQRLLVTGRISRVLILVPESLIHQWFVEVLRKFNLWFNIFDEERCESLEESAPEGNPFLDNQLIICSTEFLAGSRKRASQAIKAGWDMLVVDEAHHLEWSVDEVSPEYSIVDLLSQATEGLLLLTATPEQLGVESHFARLRLLDPNRYTNFEDFKNEPEGNKDIADLVEKLSSGADIKPKDKKLSESTFSKERIAALDFKNETSRHNLIEDLLDQHGPGRVLFRNTRQAMSGFPKRIAHVVPLQIEKDHNLWIERLTNEFSYDMNRDAEENGEQEFWFNKDPRVKWVLTKMEEIYPEKILLICSTKEKVLALEAAISKAINLNVGVFHEDLSLVQRDKNAAWFADHDSAQILLCSEIGSEGRNFQFAHHLILFDVPFHPELLEQRIGRLDRIGQKNDINIHIPYIVGSPQSSIVRWFHEGLNAFNTNLEGGDNISRLFSDRLLNITKNPSIEEVNSELEKLIKETADFQKELKKNLAEGRDKLLEMNSFRPKVAEKLIKQIKAEDKDKALENYLTKVFHHFDVEMEDLAARTYLLHPGAFNADVFPTIPQEGIQVTFDRKRAISRDDISFLSWDHPMATGAIDMVMSSTFGSASFGILKSSGSSGLLLELIFVLETAGKESIDIDRFLPHTPIRIVVDHTGKEVTDLYSIELLNKNLIPSRIDALLENDAFVDILIPNMISSATEIAKDLGDKEIEKGLKRMKLKLNHEIDRLTSLQEKNQHIRPDEIETAMEERNTLSAIINKARVRLDALQLIRKEKNNV
ncbi:RNA polymerase-associated protein RapA [Brumimicrobium glaciale]|uniref:RNA polymerase-associated protein RapA n=1 Tax=Brumimicrobium glaciale TaxID=200475 RepID=A0A4Q4KQU3_9FLAO|nr:RNA polymerase-associated protein RapA [Brumimicrobium glaciale]RYM35890.1 RNA polymerase-associated protein RapA [Brumimicrobium glaciale]